jgi:hypothetical protein
MLGHAHAIDCSWRRAGAGADDPHGVDARRPITVDGKPTNRRDQRVALSRSISLENQTGTVKFMRA